MCSLLLLEEFRSLTLDKEAGCANRTPWYITELISNETTKELSPDSPVKHKELKDLVSTFFLKEFLDHPDPQF